ncbi:MAG: chemotaxis protein, partial [Burkholderiales bacterium PBB5]
MRNNGPVTQQEHVLSAGTTLVSTTDLQSRITYCNPAFIAVSGFTREELVGQPHNLVRHPDMPAEAFRDLWATLQAGEPWTALVKNRRKNGDHYWVRANVTPVLEAGKVTGYMSVRTAPGRQEVADAEALYARMREQAASGHVTHTLACGELRTSSAVARLRRMLHPGLGARLSLTVLAGTALTALSAAAMQGFGLWASLPVSLLVGGAAALWIRHQALIPLREAITVVRRMSAGDLSQTLQS